MRPRQCLRRRVEITPQARDRGARDRGAGGPRACRRGVGHHADRDGVPLSVSECHQEGLCCSCSRVSCARVVRSLIHLDAALFDEPPEKTASVAFGRPAKVGASARAVGSGGVGDEFAGGDDLADADADAAAEGIGSRAEGIARVSQWRAGGSARALGLTSSRRLAHKSSDGKLSGYTYYGEEDRDWGRWQAPIRAVCDAGMASADGG